MAHAMDTLIKTGVDLGPLMGVPIAIKDVFNINDYPSPNAGSLVNFEQFIGSSEGTFIDALKRCGIVILGTTKAVEFCLGITGVSTTLGTPVNPYDSKQQRIPGGSSSGSAVATAAGLCAFAIGTDSGGSVRVPAAYNGLFGIKTTFGRWSTDGTVPLDPSVDSIGLLTHSAKDAKIAFHAIERQLFGQEYVSSTQQVNLNSLVLGKPNNIFYENLDVNVQKAVQAAELKLTQAGCTFVDFEFTEAAERSQYFPITMPVSVLSMLGQDFFNAARPKMDKVVGDRIATGVGVDAVTLMQRQNKRTQSINTAKRYFDNINVIACPTTISVAPCLSEFDNHESAMKHALGMTQNTQPSNYLEQCAVSIPLPTSTGQLTIGYQLIGAANSDEELVNIAIAIENILGSPAAPDLQGFL